MKKKSQSNKDKINQNRNGKPRKIKAKAVSLRKINNIDKPLAKQIGGGGGWEESV